MPKPLYNTKTFTQIWDEYSAFLEDYLSLPEGMQVMKKKTTEGVDSYPTLNVLFYLLYARYGNNPITNFDEEQFKYKLFGIIFSKGPYWEKKLDIQNALRGLQEDDIIKGGKAIYNAATNPSDDPSTSTLEELDYINSQNTTNYVKTKMEGYAQLMSLLEEDVTSRFIDEFKILFKTFVRPEHPILYVEETEDEI